MDLFAVVNLEMPRSVTVGVRPLREGETPILEATAGRVVDLVVPSSEGSPSVVVAAPVQSVAPLVQQEPDTAQTPPNSVNIAIVNLEESEEEMEEESTLSRKRARSDDGEGSFKRSRFEAREPSVAEVQMR